MAVARLHWVPASFTGLVLAFVLFASADHRPRLTCHTHCLAITPDGTYDPDRAASTSGWTTVFNVTNNSSDHTFSYLFNCSATGGVSCTGIDNSSATLGPGGSTNVTATYDVGTSGGNVVLAGAGDGELDTGTVKVAVPPSITLLAPVVSGLAKFHSDSCIVHTRTPLILALLSSHGAPIDSTSLVVTFGGDTVTAITRRNKGVVEWEVDTTWQLTPGTPKVLTIRICDTNSGCTTKTEPVVLDNSGTPIVSFSGMPLEAQGRHFASPFGPGVSVSGPDVETGLSVPSYTSMGVARSTGLTYSTRQAYPRALVNTDIELTWPSGAPDSLKATLIDGTTRLDSLRTDTSSHCTGGNGHQCRITLQGDFSGSTWTGAIRKWLKVEVTAYSSGAMKTTTDSVEVVLVDRRASRFGRGWYASSVVRLQRVGTDLIAIAPNGAATVYRGDSTQWISPPGDFGVFKTGGGGFTLSYRDNTRIQFDTTGRITSVTDANANQTAFTYGGVSDSLLTITDPVGHLFKFAYATGSITITDTMPGQSRGRHTRVFLDDSSRVATDSLPVDATHCVGVRFAYTNAGSNHGNLLTRYSTPLHDSVVATTAVAYDARHRPTQDTMPSVLGDTGFSLQKPIITYRAMELRGLDTLVSTDSLYVQIADPLDHWTRSTLNRWGAATRTWDALGTIARAAYTPDGFTAWSESKVADSTRVYNTYDAFGRLARTYRYRAAGDMVRLDSVVYSSSHEVIKRINALGQRDSTTYDAYFNVTGQWTPSGDHTAYTVLSTGQVSTAKPPSAGTTTYTYSSTFKNVETVVSAGAALLTNSYDAFGRLSETKRLIVASVVPAKVQWRRTRTWYNDLNQVDSARTERTLDCDAPCISPSWPADTATSQWQQVTHLYDLARHDTARVSTSGRRTRYVYDELGRLRYRYPWSDSAAVVDSFRYDLAGNVRFHWTRRGVQVEHHYDSRNRDTLTSVPGIGDYRRGYLGPNDEATKVWIDNYVDSIGGVDTEVRWGYSQAGLALADTAQGNRTSAHTHDRYGRDSVVADVNGTWAMRYDGTRGVLDTVYSPFGDTLHWAVDSLWRPIGPYIQSGRAFRTVQRYDSTRKLFELADSVGTGRVGDHSVDGDEPDVDYLPVWMDHIGTMSDSLAHDGWARVTKAVYAGAGGPLTESFSFGAEGDIVLAGESRTYNNVGQLAVRGGHYYGYDRAGNLVSDSTGSGVWNYSYDPLDRLVAARYNGSVISRYAYDANGRRIVRRVYAAGPNSAATGYNRMVYGGDQVIAEADSGGTLTLGYTWGLETDDEVAVHKYGAGSGDWYVIQDRLHNVRGLTKRDSTWLGSWRYRVYGAVLAESLSVGLPFEARYRWTGREFDTELSWYFFRGRHYDPAAERFVQEDASGFDGGLNLYMYGDGDPTTGRDPDGMSKDYGYSAGTSEADKRLASCMGTTRGCGGGSFGIDFDQMDNTFADHDHTMAEERKKAAGGKSSKETKEPDDRVKPLSQDQIAALGNACELVDCSQIRIVWVKHMRPVTMGYNILLRVGSDPGQVAHEIWHVYQYEHWGATVYYLRALWTQLGYQLGFAVYDVKNWTRSAISDYGMEQQSMIVQACYNERDAVACALSPMHPGHP